MAEAQQPKKVKLTVSQIQQDLKDGINRDGIAEKYNLSKADVARLFKHEKLKGLKVRQAPAFELEDDLATETAATATTATATAQEPAASVDNKVDAPTGEAKASPVTETAPTAITEKSDNTAGVTAAVDTNTASTPATEDAKPASEPEATKGVW